TVLSFFNWLHIFFLLPFTIVLMREGLNPVGAIGWFFGIFALIFANNFLNILSDNNKVLLYGLGLILVSAGTLHFLGIFDPTVYTEPLFNALYTSPVYALIPVLVLCLLAYLTFMFFRNHLYLDSGLSIKQKDAQTENYSWLNQFGTLGTFLKNDIKLIKRNKRSRTTILMSVLFIFYGLLFFTGAIEAYEGPLWRIFAGIFVTGGFLFTFGQFVPSWDSSYYPLMMSQNVQYREYINAKWWLIVIATLITTILSSF